MKSKAKIRFEIGSLLGLVSVCLVMGILSGCGVSQAAGEKLVLVENGEALAPIVVFENAPPKTRRAVGELAEYMELIAGVRPEVIEGRPDPIPENAIWVGHQPVVSELFPGIDFDFNEPEEILIAANENHLVIAGRDKWDPDNLNVEARSWTIEGKQFEYGTINAVYTFLQDYLDVRWILPGEIGIDVVEQEKIAISPFEYRYSPQITGRSTIFRFSAPGDGRGLTHEWTRFQRLQLDSLSLPGGHAFTDWWDRFHESNPEFFALQPDGSRGGGDNPYPAARTVKMCKSNPDLWDQWLDDVEAELERNPNVTVFNASFNDSWRSGFCICEDCREWDVMEAEPRSMSWRGVTQNYVALSDRNVRFANVLARMLKERYPDEDYHVLIMAYGPVRPAPVEAVPEDNVIISSVANFLFRDPVDRGSTWGTTHREQFESWGKVASNIVWRPNTGSPAGWQQGLPDIPITQTMKDLRFTAENNIIGIFIDTVWEHWATQGPLYYLMAQMAWDPYVDGEKVMDDYYRRGFGKAADDMKSYWRLMENAREDYVEGDMPYWEVYNDELFEEVDDDLNAAAGAVEGEPEKYLQRIEFFRAGADYTRNMSDSRRLMGRVEDDPEAAERIRANSEEIRRIQQKFPDAFNRHVRPGQHRVSGYHLDD